MLNEIIASQDKCISELLMKATLYFTGSDKYISENVSGLVTKVNIIINKKMLNLN